jgi:hypothetical protein
MEKSNDEGRKNLLIIVIVRVNLWLIVVCFSSIHHNVLCRRGYELHVHMFRCMLNHEYQVGDVVVLMMLI